MKTAGGLIVAIVVIVLFVASGGVFVVDETQQVIITQFGKPVGTPITEAGLHFKIPMIQKANFFEKRWLEWDGDANQITTKDKKYIWVDTYARWRISDPLKFFETMTNEMSAQGRLDDIIDGETRVNVAKFNLIELVRTSNRQMNLTISAGAGKTDQLDFHVETGREKISRLILNRIKKVTPTYGIQMVDFRIKRLNYEKSVRAKVYERMISERLRIAEQYRSEGQGKKAEVIGKTQRELERIQSESYRKSEEIKGKADAQATKIYADTYSKDPDFYKFLKSLEALKATASKKQTLILSTDSEFYELMKRYK
ncbi:MAG: protease modulator HflC [Acidobacteria bacterium]|nr:MAG: protease modulator HflC [Acidobacteriota bacterium]